MRNPIQLFKGSLGIFAENVWLFVGILAVPAVLAFVAGLFEPPQDTGVINISEWLFFGALTLITAIVNVFMAIALIFAVDNRSLTVVGAYAAAKGFFWRYIGLSLLISAILLLAFILFIIPGIIVSVWFTFATFVLVLERTKIIDALKRSREYVRGKWWGVFGRLIALMLIVWAIMIILFAIVMMIGLVIPGNDFIQVALSTIIGFALGPIVMGYSYLLYQDAKGAPVVASMAATNAAEGY